MQKSSSRNSLKRKQSAIVGETTFRISKINLNNNTPDFRNLQSQTSIRKTLQLQALKQLTTTTKESLQSMMSTNRNHNFIGLGMPSLTSRRAQRSLDLLRPVSCNQKSGTASTQVNGYQHPEKTTAIINKMMGQAVALGEEGGYYSNDLKEFKIQPAKVSKKDYGQLRAYAVNTQIGLISDSNQDRLSVVTNLLPYETPGAPPISFFGIYDGQNGHTCAEFLRDNLHGFVVKDENFPNNLEAALRNAIKRAEYEFSKFVDKKKDQSGSSILVVILQGNSCVTANLGDSRALMSQGFGKSTQQLTVDHVPHVDTEFRRIVRAGGSLFQFKNTPQAKGYPYRIVPGKFSVSRGIGYTETKLTRPNLLSNQPEITKTQINSETDFILLASDGVFDYMSNAEVVKTIWGYSIARRKSNIHQQAGEAVNRVIGESLHRHATDTLSCLLLCFRAFQRTLFEEQTLKLPSVD